MRHDIRWTSQKIAQRLKLIEPLTHRKKHALQPFWIKAVPDPLDNPLDHPLPTDPANAGWQQLAPRTYWGEQDLNFVIHGEFIVPPEFARHDTSRAIGLYLPLGEGGDFSHPEALAYIDGTSYGTTDRHHQEFLLAAQHCDGESHRLMLHGWTGSIGSWSIQPGKQLFMYECAVVEIDQTTRTFIAAARSALQAADLMEEGEPAKTRLYNALDATFTVLDTREPLNGESEAFYASVHVALETLHKGIEAAGLPLEVDVIAAGHAHIDVTWLWTLGQTRRKVGRTFHTVMRLMEQFPDYTFTQSQPQLYDYLRQDYPDLFAAIKERIHEGRWEPIGGMWVEADCNLSGSESLARQFVLGRKFFRENFGAGTESPVLWLPDVFGYAWNLPQLIKLAGLDYFFTIKIGWNQYNKLPYDSFWWQGLDGTKVLTHFSTAPEISGRGAEDLRNMATYNANLTALTVLGSWLNLKQKAEQRVLLMSYGYGDGGGGPTREMNENAQVLKHFPALPRVRQGKVIDFFRRLEAESGDNLPTWNGELYFELHRGTYTSQSRNKRANRKAEFLLHDAEFAAAIAARLDPSFEYPDAAFQQAWELICLNQFHDIIPGSSIHAVYTESQEQYESVRALGESARDAALESIQAVVGGDLLILNPTSFGRDDLAFWQGEVPPKRRLAREDLFLTTQAVEGGSLIDFGAIGMYSAVPLRFAGEFDTGRISVAEPVEATENLLENEYLRVEFNAAGDITRIYDKVREREVLPPNSIANQWQAFEDRPLRWDAWDIDIFYDDKRFLAEPAESIRVVEGGPLRATLEIKRRILHSTYTQRVSLAYNHAQLDFETVIDWRERHILLKTAFPVDVLTPVATYEIQWGNVQRSTHRNTSWDWARFESCAHKWVDLSEHNFGVALLNDCKYGHDIQENVIRLSLLRAPTSPDPEADQGEHQFAYSLFVHGAAAPSDIAARAYALNDPLIVVEGGAKAKATNARQFIAVEGDAAIIETIKGAEDGNGLIVRLYECNRSRGWITLTAGFPIQEAFITNLLEENQESVSISERRVRVFLKPFQILTLRLV